MNASKLEIMEKTPVTEAIIKLAVPTILGMIVQIVYNLVDTFFVGKLGDPNQVAAVSISMPFFMLIMAIGFIFAIGGASYISRKLGEKDFPEVKKISATAFYTCIITGMISCVLGFMYAESLLKMAGASENTMGFAWSYLRTILMGCVAIMLNFALGQLIRAEGRAKEAMLGMFIGTGANILLDPVFILALGMGVEGAAIATVIGNLLALAYYLKYLLGPKTFLSIQTRYFKPARKIYAEIFKIGIPASVNSVLMSAAFAFANSVASDYGDNVVAAMGIVMRLNSAAVLIFIGLGQGIQPLIGYCYGAGIMERLKQIVKTAGMMAVLFGTIMTGLFAVFADTWIKVFIDNRDVINIGVKVMYAHIVAMPFLGIQFVLMNVFQGLGKGVPALIITVSRQGLVYIPAIIILNSLFGFSGFIYAQSLADYATIIFAIILFIRITAKLDKSIENDNDNTERAHSYT